jgi:fructose-1,6-bisphosphatase I
VISSSIPFKSGVLTSINPSGETQKAIDVFSNDEFAEAMQATGATGQIVSEEMAEPLGSKGKVNVAMDPLDGSSNVETNNPLGSIFGFYSKPFPTSGRSLVGALYVTYGRMLTMTLSFGKGVHRFVAVREGSEMVYTLTGVNLKLPEKPEVYGFGGNRSEWIPPIQRFVDSLGERGLRIRYCGTFVGDYNQVLSRGGVFAYPQLTKKPEGKLRLHFETAPIAYINAQAGGYSTDGRRDILDIEATSLAQPSPAYIGNSSLTKEIERLVGPAA